MGKMLIMIQEDAFSSSSCWFWLNGYSLNYNQEICPVVRIARISFNERAHDRWNIQLWKVLKVIGIHKKTHYSSVCQV